MGIIEMVEAEIKRRAADQAERDGVVFRAALVELMDRHGGEPLFRGAFAAARSVDEYVRVRTEILTRNAENNAARRLIGEPERASNE